MNNNFEIGDRVTTPAKFTGTVIKYWFDSHYKLVLYHIAVDHRPEPHNVYRYEENDLTLISTVRDIET